MDGKVGLGDRERGKVTRAGVQAIVVVFCAGATWYLGRQLDAGYPIQDWLFWHLAAVWGWELSLVAAWLSLGDLLVVRALGLADLPRLERLVFSLAGGVVAFVVAMFALGGLGLFRPAVAAALPVVCILGNWRRFTSGVGGWLRGPRQPLTLQPLAAAAACFGVLCLAIVYLETMTPSAIGCDAAWFHMSAAEDYAREGRLVPFLADWAKALPQLTSILHTWAFLVPGLRTEVRWMLALHTEFVLFLGTLLSVVPTVRWLTRREHDGGVTWVLFFLFPAIFVYDSNLAGGADHVQAFFVLPLLLAALRAVDRPDPRMATFAGIMAGGALLTKAQGTYVVVPLAGLLAGRALLSLWRARDRGRGDRGTALESDPRPACVGLACFGGAATLVMAPHFIKNAVFYRNPVYPFLMGMFPGSRPAMADSSTLFYEHLAPVIQPLTWPNVERALTVVASFPFVVHSSFSPSNLPFIGAVFSLLLPLVLLRREPRLWGATLVALFALFAWAFAFPTPRNLQTFLPVLVAVAGALVVEVWRVGTWARVSVACLLALQGVWEGDELFYEGHGRIGDSLALIRSGAEGHAARRFRAYRAGFRALDAALPMDAVVLLHTTYSQLGINRRTLLDWPGFQGLIDYRPMQAARDVYDRYRELGITHLAIDPAWPAHSRQEEVVFDAFLYRHAQPLGRIGDFVVWEMPTRRPPSEAAYRVLCLSIPDYSDGLYDIGHLDNLDDGRRVHKRADEPLDEAEDALGAMRKADAVVDGHDASLDQETREELQGAFQRVIGYPAYDVYLRRRRGD